MLKKVIRPDGRPVEFRYDALGRRTAKQYFGKVTRWVWDGNVPVHEWSYKAIGLQSNEKENTTPKEPAEDVTTWVFEAGTFVPTAKIQESKQYSIVSDYLGTPFQMYDGQGNKTWDCTLDIYGKITSIEGNSLNDCPFRYAGHYFDSEINLCYNRFRYYSPEIGCYLSQDPIGFAGGNPTLYGYVTDTNIWLDPFGLKRGNESFPSWMSTRQGYERHHIIPYEHRNHEIFKITGMNVNNATNMIYLPVNESIHPTKAVHHEFKLNGKNHSEYNALMRRELDYLLERSKAEKWTLEQARRELLNIEYDTREKLNKARTDNH